MQAVVDPTKEYFRVMIYNDHVCPELTHTKHICGMLLTRFVNNFSANDIVFR